MSVNHGLREPEILCSLIVRLKIFILTDNFNHDDVITVVISLLCILCVHLCMGPCVPDTFLYRSQLYSSRFVLSLDPEILLSLTHQHWGYRHMAHHA